MAMATEGSEGSTGSISSYTIAEKTKMISKCAKMTSVLILCIVNLINYMDRYTVSGVLTQIQEDFDIDHEQGGLLQTAFVICYFMSAPIFGFLGDRYSRKILMIVGVATWGACTAASSFMPNYWSFLAFRAAIGFGESGFTTLAPTVIGDLFQGSSRIICLALFYYAIPVGSGLGYMVGSAFAEAANDWRWGVRFTPFLNLVAVVVMIFFLADPPRGEAELHVQPVTSSGEPQRIGSVIKSQLSTWGQDLKYLIKNRSYVLSTLAFTALTFCTGALAWWGPTFIEKAIRLRSELGHPIDIQEGDVSFVFGIVMCIAGIAGLTLGSGLSFFLRKRFPWVDPVICGVGLLISTPFIFAALATAVSSGVITAFALMFFGQVFLNMNWAIVVDISLYVVVPHRRASAEAFQLMASHALGEAGSPYLSGLIADSVTDGLTNTTSRYNSSLIISDDERDYFAFQTAMYSSVGFELLSAIFFLLTTIYVLSDKRKAEEEEEDRVKALSHSHASHRHENQPGTGVSAISASNSYGSCSKQDY